MHACRSTLEDPTSHASAQGAEASAPQVGASPQLAQALSVEPGATCLQRDELLARVSHWFGRSALDPAVSVVVRGDPNESRKLAFVVRRAGVAIAERRFSPAPFACAQLHDVVGLAVAIALRAPTPPKAQAAPLPQASGHGAWELDAAALATRNFGGRFGVGGDVGASLRLWRWFGLRAAALVTHSFREPVRGTGGKYDTVILGFALSGCASSGVVRRLSARVCTGPVLGPLFARGTSYERSSTSALLWSAWSGRVEGRVLLGGGFSLLAGAMIALPLRELQVWVQDRDKNVIGRANVEGPHLAALLGLTLRL